MSQIKQIAVNRPADAAPYHALRQFSHTLSARPSGAWLVKLARRLIQSPPVSSIYGRVLHTFSAAEHLTFQASPASSVITRHGELTVITANLWHDWPRHRRHLDRLEAFAQLVEEQRADVLLLQEVARVGDFQADAWLAERLGMAYAYAQANGDHQRNNFEEGVAVLSRYPLADPALCHLAPRPFSLVRRLALGVTVQAPGGDFLAVSAHLGHGRRLNTRQLNRLQEWVEASAGERPAVVGGDFNTGENSPQMRRLRHAWLDLFRWANPDAQGATFHWRWPWGAPLFGQRLDYLFLKPGPSTWPLTGAATLQSSVLAHSDHLAVLARLLTRNRPPPGDRY